MKILNSRGFIPIIYLIGILVVGVITVILAVVITGNTKPKIGPAKIGPTQINTTQNDISQVTKNSEAGWPSIDAKYITVVPVDLAQIESMSLYRSCSGHDNSGYSFERNLETDRSMKHYIYPVSAYQGTIDKVKMFAPFDGAVSKMTLESDEIGKPGKRPKTGNGITFSTPVDKNVGFLFAHIYFIRDFKIGDTIKAGELVGYAALGAKGNDFDIVLESRLWTDDKQPILDSIFNHMTDEVLAEFAKYGITPENTKFTKKYRDQHPCNYAIARKNTGTEDEDWVQLKH